MTLIFLMDKVSLVGTLPFMLKKKKKKKGFIYQLGELTSYYSKHMKKVKEEKVGIGDKDFFCLRTFVFNEKNISNVAR